MPSSREIAELKAEVRRGLRLFLAGLRLFGIAGGRLAWIALRRVLGIAFALLLLFEQWGWRPLSAALARLARFAPFAALERLIAGLPPYAALVAFALPTVLLVPLKLLSLYLIANGHAVSAAALFVGAKIVGTAIVARLYQLTLPRLMQITWVRRAHDVLLPRLQAVHDMIRASWAWRVGRLFKARTKRSLNPLAGKLKARISDLLGIGRAAS